MDGFLHNPDGPAINDKNHKEWWLHGVRHRIDGPAIIINDIEEWWLHGVRHRVDGPQCTVKGKFRIWIQNDKVHRLDGPAYIADDGSGEVRWFVDDINVTESVSQWMSSGAVPENHEDWTDQHKMLFKLVYGKPVT